MSLFLRLLKPISCGRLFGIPLEISPAFFALLGLPLLLPEEAPEILWKTHAIVALAAALLIHELGHAVMAKKMGLEVLSITLYPLVGMARIRGLQAKSNLEFIVSAAGPVANLLVALPLWSLIPEPYTGLYFNMQLLLGLGNLMPLFPMDGGRMLRSRMAQTQGFVQATRKVLRITQINLCVVLIIAWWFGFIIPAVALAAYILLAGRKELNQES